MNNQNTFYGKLKKNIMQHWALYLFVLPALTVTVIFRYIPMYGLQIAFKNYYFATGINGSSWAGMNGFQHFYRFFNSMDFWKIIRNTFSISFYTLLIGFPFPIILALMINQLKSERAKRVIQTVTYMPHFISIVVMVGIILLFLSPSTGLYGNFCKYLGISPINIMGEARLFSSVYVWSDVWQNTGWNSIIYLAAISSIDPSLYEAAKIDGASRLMIIKKIDIPHLMPTIMMLLILRCGRLLLVGFEKVYLMQNNLNLASSEIITTYEYKMGILNQNFSYGSAIGLFNTVVNFSLLIIVNKLSHRATGNSLWSGN